jgi:dihydropyrimidinase
MTFAELTGAATYIVHLSCKEALDQAIAARQRGVRVSVETLIQYLTLDKTYAEKLPDFEGAKYVMSPPLRDKRNQEICGTACATAWCKPSRPTMPVRFQNAKGDGQK